MSLREFNAGLLPDPPTPTGDAPHAVEYLWRDGRAHRLRPPRVIGWSCAVAALLALALALRLFS